MSSALGRDEVGDRDRHEQRDVHRGRIAWLKRTLTSDRQQHAGEDREERQGVDEPGRAEQQAERHEALGLEQQEGHAEHEEVRAEATDRRPRHAGGAEDRHRCQDEDERQRREVVGRDRLGPQVQERPVVGRGLRARVADVRHRVDAGRPGAARPRAPRPSDRRRGSPTRCRPGERAGRSRKTSRIIPFELRDEPRLAIEVVHGRTSPPGARWSFAARERLLGEQERLEPDAGRRAHQRQRVGQGVHDQVVFLA